MFSRPGLDSGDTLPIRITAPTLEELPHEAREALIEHPGPAHCTVRVRVRREPSAAVSGILTAGLNHGMNALASDGQENPYASEIPAGGALSKGGVSACDKTGNRSGVKGSAGSMFVMRRFPVEQLPCDLPTLLRILATISTVHHQLS
ncbi:hypothetical protein NZK33_15590 [Cyanobium sp. FGCU-6]|jgi:hypothetical protein|nr:hypothetical protein [Cyanobium sp. FGCU6]